MKFRHPNGSVTSDLPYFPHMGQYEALVNEGFEPIEDESVLEGGTGNLKPANESERCKGVTTAGNQCRKKAVEGSDYCEAHKPAEDLGAPASVTAPTEAPADADQSGDGDEGDESENSN